MDKNKKKSGEGRPDEKQAFQLPDDYFKEFEARLSERMLREGHRSILDDPKLRVLPFRLPNEYLDTFEAKIDRRWREKRKTRVVRMMNLSVAIAACMILFFGIKEVINAPGPSESMNAAMIEELDLELWFEDQESLNAYDIAEVLEIDDINGEFVSTDALEDHLEINQIEYLLLDP